MVFLSSSTRRFKIAGQLEGRGGECGYWDFVGDTVFKRALIWESSQIGRLVASNVKGKCPNLTFCTFSSPISVANPKVAWTIDLNGLLTGQKRILKNPIPLLVYWRCYKQHCKLWNLSIQCYFGDSRISIQQQDKTRYHNTP